MAKTDRVSPSRLESAAALPDAALLSRVRELAGRERAAVADLVAHLAELDARKLYRGEGYASLFVYCTSELRLSEHGAYNRIEAARAARKFPVVLDLLADGSLNLATLRLLAPHVTAENCEALFDQASGKSKRDVELLVAQLAPRPDVATTVRRLPTPLLQSSGASATAGAKTAELRDDPDIPGHLMRAAADPPLSWTAGPILAPRRAVLEPLSPERYRLQFTVGRATHERLRLVQALLRREIPDGDVAAIFDRALIVLLAETERKKLAATTRPRSARLADADSRHIPAEVKRAVWRRDGGQCAFVAPSGRRCSERAFLEFHHRRPWAAGGQSTSENIALRCRTHNMWEAEVFYGPISRGELAPGRVDSS